MTALPLAGVRVYVAGSSDELDRVRAAIAAVRELGGEVTHDWPAAIDAADGRANRGLTYEQRRAAALARESGVHLAHAVWALIPEPTRLDVAVQELVEAIRIRLDAPLRAQRPRYAVDAAVLTLERRVRDFGSRLSRGGAGLWYELGLARERGAWTCASGDAERSVFTELLDAKTATDQAGLDALVTWARGRT